MPPPQLTDFQEFIVDLPDRRKLIVDRLVPVTNNDYFVIPAPAERTEGSSVVGFLMSASGGTIAAPNFYLGSTDNVRLVNRKGQQVVIATLNDGHRSSFIPEFE